MDLGPDVILSRRRFLQGSLAFSATALLPSLPVAAESAFAVPAETAAQLVSSPLIYLSPIRSDGTESACHAEIWFAADGNDVFVVTSEERWRSQAVKKGLDRARIWVGDFGVWKKSGGRFKEAPTFMAKADFVGADARATQDRVLALFGEKYASAWGSWGPKFRSGLADGSRVMLRYQAAGA
jgi:hypothetical protein